MKMRLYAILVPITLGLTILRCGSGADKPSTARSNADALVDQLLDEMEEAADSLEAAQSDSTGFKAGQ